MVLNNHDSLHKTHSIYFRIFPIIAPRICSVNKKDGLGRHLINYALPIMFHNSAASLSSTQRGVKLASHKHKSANNPSIPQHIIKSIAMCIFPTSSHITKQRKASGSSRNGKQCKKRNRRKERMVKEHKKTSEVPPVRRHLVLKE